MRLTNYSAGHLARRRFSRPNGMLAEDWARMLQLKLKVPPPVCSWVPHIYLPHLVNLQPMVNCLWPLPWRLLSLHSMSHREQIR